MEASISVLQLLILAEVKVTKRIGGFSGKLQAAHGRYRIGVDHFLPDIMFVGRGAISGQLEAGPDFRLLGGSGRCRAIQFDEMHEIAQHIDVRAAGLYCIRQVEQVIDFQASEVKPKCTPLSPLTPLSWPMV